MFITCLFIGIAMLILTQCVFDAKQPDPRGDDYAGSATCIKCHANTYNSYLHTAHYNTSKLTDTVALGKKLKQSGTQYAYNTNLSVEMAKLKGKYYQVGYQDGKVMEQHQMDITFGCVKGENYFSWNDDQIFQLPIAYYNARQTLTTSPGYNITYPDFSRVIPQRCLECHTSFAKGVATAAQQKPVINFEKSSMVFGIDCERCHGPAALHVQFQTINPDSLKARYIKPFRSLTRQQRLDLCSSCHSGNKSYMMRSIFSFKPGDDMANYKLPDANSPYDVLDVHGNQLQFLQRSKCFINSKMDCNTCHDTHKEERGNANLFATRCITCHAESHNNCKLSNGKNAEFLKVNCVKCHMPSLPSTAIVVHTANGEAIPYNMTTHDIKVYPEEARKVMGMLSKNQIKK